MIIIHIIFLIHLYSATGDQQWCFSQVKGTVDDDIAEGLS